MIHAQPGNLMMPMDVNNSDIFEGGSQAEVAPGDPKQCRCS